MLLNPKSFVLLRVLFRKEQISRLTAREKRGTSYTRRGAVGAATRITVQIVQIRHVGTAF